MNLYRKIKCCATNLQKLGLGFSIKPYIWVTKSRTISLRTSGVNIFSSIVWGDVGGADPWGSALGV